MIRLLVALLPFMLLLCIALPVHSEETPATTPQEANYLILKMDGDEIYYDDVQEIWNDLFPGEGEAPPLAGFGDKVRDNVIRGIITERLMIKEAETLELDKTPEVTEQLNKIKQKLMIKALLDKRTNEIPEKEIKALYEETIAKMDGKEEIHASHILVEEEAAAKMLLEKLEDGTPFEELAKENSTDKGTAVHGGDLGFFTKEQMVPEFADAAFELKVGEVSEPVKSSFGWHIIKIHERRALPVPTLEEAREQIVKTLARKANQEYVIDLLSNADITYYGPDGEEREINLEAMDESE